MGEFIIGVLMFFGAMAIVTFILGLIIAFVDAITKGGR